MLSIEGRAKVYLAALEIATLANSAADDLSLTRAVDRLLEALKEVETLEDA